MYRPAGNIKYHMNCGWLGERDSIWLYWRYQDSILIYIFDM